MKKVILRRDFFRTFFYKNKNDFKNQACRIYKNSPLVIFLATKKVIAAGHYKFWFVVLFIFFFITYIIVPAWLTPANNISFQLNMLTTADYVLLVVLSAAASLFALMQIFLFLRTIKGRAGIAVQGGIGAFSAFFGGLLATAACPSCLAVISGFLGTGGVFFIFKNQPYIAAGSVALIAIGLYFSARRIVNACQNCKAPRRSCF